MIASEDPSEPDPRRKVRRDISDSPTERILSRHEAGDRYALEDFYKYYHAKLVAIAGGKMSDQLRRHQSAEDVVQEVFARAKKEFDPLELNDRAHIEARFVQLIERVIVDLARKLDAKKRKAEGGEVRLDAGEHPIDPPGKDPTPSRVVARNEFKSKLPGYLAQLLPEHRRVLELRVGRKLPVEQVATILGKSADAVSQLESRAKAALKQCIERDGEPPSVIG